MTSPLRVFLIDDQRMIRAAFRHLLGELDGVEVVGDHGDARAALGPLREQRPDVVLLDITMPGLSGLDAIQHVRDAAPGVRVLMLTHHEGATFVEAAFAAGALGYVSKDSQPEELALALDAARRGERYVSPRVRAGSGGNGHAATAGDARPLDALTPREREVFQLLALGRVNKEVARELGMSLGTAKKHRENLQRKLGSRSAADLARLAIREGLLAT